MTTEKDRCPECGTVIMPNGFGVHHSASCKMIGINFNVADAESEASACAMEEAAIEWMHQEYPMQDDPERQQAIDNSLRAAMRSSTAESEPKTGLAESVAKIREKYGRYFDAVSTESETIERDIDVEITCKRCMRKLGIERPTVDQVAWVFRKVMENANKGTFRYLIYDLMGFDESAYEPLYLAGGMAINNAFVVDDDKDKDE